jgi:4-hydroxy-3-polyprenylbenzoate decarboxylase
MASLRTIVDDLANAGHLVRLPEPVDPCLEAAEIQRRVYLSGGPAVLFSNVIGCRFPMVSNLFGTIERARYIFRHTYEPVRRAIELKVDPQRGLKQPFRYLSAPLTAWRMRPKRVRSGPALDQSIRLNELPQLKSWPDDGGPFVTLPQVYSEDPCAPGLGSSNLGMYRVQLAGNRYDPLREVGLHYQLHRGIGVHHTAALRSGKPLKVSIFVGGHPAMSVAAVMPLPEGMSELTFAGALAGERIRMIPRAGGGAIYADADFCIAGTIDLERRLPEGPFGDHLGYYSLTHEFPVLNVEQVTCREGAIWPFTVVGRPPQEDTTFGQLIHELTGPVIPTVLPGVREVHAVDAAGVHPLLLAIGSERYMPFHRDDRPREILTKANAILGQGQMSLAKYLVIANAFDDESLDLHDPARFFSHMLERVDWRRDLHFQTCTTIDTLDYSGEGFNAGSKVVIAATGKPIRTLARELPADLRLPAGWKEPRLALPGVFTVQASPELNGRPARELAAALEAAGAGPWENLPLVVVVDDSPFAAKTLNNWLWVTFTRSNPSIDLDGVGAFTVNKHWGCTGPVVIDARVKPHHAPPLREDPEITRRVDALAARGGVLAKWL